MDRQKELAEALNESLSHIGLFWSLICSWPSTKGEKTLHRRSAPGYATCANFLGNVRVQRTEEGGLPGPGHRTPGKEVGSLTMVVTQLNLEFRFQGKKLRGFSCELTRSPCGVFPETAFTLTCQVLVPLLLSGLGMMSAGLLMNTIQVRTGHLRGQCGVLGWGNQGPQASQIGQAAGHRRPLSGAATLSPASMPGSRAQCCWQKGPPGTSVSEIHNGF